MRIAVVLGFAVVVGLGWLRSAVPTAPVPHRSPMDVVVLPAGKRALTANHTSDSISLLDLDAGKVLVEAKCGRKPVAVAISPDGRRAAVSNQWSDSVTLVEVGERTLTVVGEVGVGRLPHGLAFATGDCFYVAAGNEIAEVNWGGRRVLHRYSAPREPRCVAVSRDGKYLAAASSLSADVRVWERASRKLLWERTIADAFNLRGLIFSPGSDALLVTHAFRRELAVAKSHIESGWVIDNRMTRLPLKADAYPAMQHIALDQRAAAVADPHGLAFGLGGKCLALTASGTQEILLFDAPAIPWNDGDPGDLIDPVLTKNDGKLRRIPLGGRPMNVVITPDGHNAVIANYLLDAVQIVDLETGKVKKTIGLGGPKEPSLARRGEALFYDAHRSHHQWFSCHTCHVDGHTCGLKFDTLNDDSYGNPKLTPSLRGVSRTAPYTWHGWQKDLGAAVEKSFTETMFGQEPTADEVKAVVAFLGTLDHPPRPPVAKDQRDASERGRTLFEGKARCAHCHAGKDYTSARNYDVKLEPDGSPYQTWNPPSLRGVSERGPFLHDGRAKTLEEVLRSDHAPEKLGGQALSPAERADLIAFLSGL